MNIKMSGSESGSSEESDGPKGPPTPHKIQSLDEKSLRLDENFLAISPKITRNGFTNQNQNIVHPATNTANNTNKPLIKSQGNKTNKIVEDEKRSNKKAKKIQDYFPARRTSNRKTQLALREEKHQLLIKLIEDETEDGLKVKRFPGKGRGVVSTKRFFKNEFVVEYAGDLLFGGEAREKEERYGLDGFGCYMYYFTHNNQQYCVDATNESGRMGRLINHSRNGNLITKVVEVNRNPRLIFIAKRDIDDNEELTYDYGDRSKESLLHHPWLAN